jgi:hypothetical protein
VLATRVASTRIRRCWLCLLRRHIVLSHAVLHEYRVELEVLAEADGGEYDG